MMREPVAGGSERFLTAGPGGQNARREQGLFFSVLGPCAAEGERGPVDLGPPQRRALLLCLLLENTRPVSVSRLTQLLWADRPPSSAASSIHAHISRLRSAITGASPSSAHSLLLRSSFGYTLRLAPQQQDTTVFEHTIEQAHDLAERGHGTAARLAVERALALWRGQPFAELQGHPVTRSESLRLEEFRRTAHDLRARLLLAEGRPVQAVLAAEQLVAEAPLRETAWVTLIRALCADERWTEALGRYEMIRSLLAEMVGTSPGPELQEVRRTLLRRV